AVFDGPFLPCGIPCGRRIRCPRVSLLRAPGPAVTRASPARCTAGTRGAAVEPASAGTASGTRTGSGAACWTLSPCACCAAARRPPRRTTGPSRGSSWRLRAWTLTTRSTAEDCASRATAGRPRVISPEAGQPNSGGDSHAEGQGRAHPRHRGRPTGCVRGTEGPPGQDLGRQDRQRGEDSLGQVEDGPEGGPDAEAARRMIAAKIDPE